jgi:alpha-D-xyloside xylohydrolase
MRKKVFLFLAVTLLSTMGFAQTVESFKQYKDRVTVTLQKGVLQIYPLTSNTARIQYAEKAEPLGEELILTSRVKTPVYRISNKKDALEIILPQLVVSVDKNTGLLSYRNERGITFLSEKAGTRLLRDSSVQGEKCYQAGQGFSSPADEYLYGCGQFQDGYLNIRGLSRRLTQVNTQISIPMIVSSKGYGLLWHNYGMTEFNPCDEKITLTQQGEEKNGETVNVTSTQGNKSETRKDADFTGDVTVGESGRYSIMLDVGQSMARSWHLSIDGKKAIDFKNFWLPPTTSTIVFLAKGVHHVLVTGNKNDKPVVFYHLVKEETVFRSPVADAIDYVVFSGNADRVISAYRELSGRAPLMPIWSLGYIHCRERFSSQKQLLDNAKEFRDRHLPVDMIVQDWQYWGRYGWNAMKFDEADYPNPAQMVSDLHRMNMRLMVSVWSKSDPKSEVGQEFTKNGYYIPNTQWIDFFNPQAAQCYWKNFSKNLLRPYHIDAWWQDATEPENDDLVGRKINNGTTAGERFRNVYPLFVTKTVYEGSRKDVPDKRVFILTRSAFSGEQRYAAAVWSGDIGNDWETMRRQLTGGLNYSISGLPWWTFDAGGFFREGEPQYTDAAYHEQLLRWFQMATFSPLQRVHGYMSQTEFWRYGEQVEKVASSYLTLRYRLLPYIYSQAAAITFHNSTIMRPLVMDFSSDKQALSQSSEYMFGPAFLVAPVLKPGVDKWDVYLPQNKAGWFNFWTGSHADGGQTVKADAPLATLPLFVRGGSIIPMGKKIEYTAQAKNDTIEIRLYRGADASFTLYEDEGTNYNYEKGQYATIGFHWNELSRCLTIDNRKGSFPGMLQSRYFNIVVVDASKGHGIEMSKNQKMVRYSGKMMKFLLRE